MTVRPRTCYPCAVCGCENSIRSNWFVVSEDRWLDQLSILSWDAHFAGQSHARSVCGEKHLRTLLIHWLFRANLDFSGERNTRMAVGATEIHRRDGRGQGGRLLGALSVHRELADGAWSGSASAIESILRVVVHGFGSEFQQLRPKTSGAGKYRSDPAGRGFCGKSFLSLHGPGAPPAGNR